MPSKQADAVRAYWIASRQADRLPEDERPDTESWGDLTAEPRGVDYVEVDAGGVPAMWVVPKNGAPDRVLLWIVVFGGGAELLGRFGLPSVHR